MKRLKKNGKNIPNSVEEISNIQNEIIKIVKLAEDELLKTNFDKAVTLHSQAIDFFNKNKSRIPDRKKMKRILQIGKTIQDSKELFWEQTFILKAFEEKAVDKIPNLIESLERSIQSPKNSNVLKVVPILLVERFKKDIEGFKIRYQNLIEEKKLDEKKEFHLFVKKSLDKIQSIKRQYQIWNLDENFKYRKGKKLNFGLSLIDEVFNKIINMEISKEQFNAIKSDEYLPTVYIEPESSIFAAFFCEPDEKISYYCDGLPSRNIYYDPSGIIEKDFLPILLVFVWVNLGGPDPYDVVEITKYLNSLKTDSSYRQEMRNLNLEIKNKILKFNEIRSKEIIEKLQKILRVSNRIRLDMMNNVLGLDKVLFDNLIFDWAAEFGFRIDGDFILIDNADIDAFISSLDKQFEMWGKTEKSSI